MKTDLKISHTSTFAIGSTPVLPHYLEALIVADVKYSSPDRKSLSFYLNLSEHGKKPPIYSPKGTSEQNFS